MHVLHIPYTSASPRIQFEFLVKNYRNNSCEEKHHGCGAGIFVHRTFRIYFQHGGWERVGHDGKTINTKLALIFTSCISPRSIHHGRRLSHHGGTGICGKKPSYNTRAKRNLAKKSCSEELERKFDLPSTSKVCVISLGFKVAMWQM